MSSATNELPALQRHLELTSGNIFWGKALVQMIFGCLFLLDSLFFVLSYATFDFFGARNSPFFGWLQHLSRAMQILYFPSLGAALLSIGSSGSGEKGKLAERLAFLGVVIQVCAGATLVLLQAGYYGWALLFGPNLHSLIGLVDPYTQAVVGLIPLIWISAIHVATSYNSARRQQIPNSLRLSSFLLAGLTFSVLYAAAARMRWTAVEHPFGVASSLVSISANLAVFAFFFVVLQWIRLLANRCPNPGLVQFSLRAIAAWIVLAVLIRRVIFALLSFNDNRANTYAVLFSLAIVLFTAGLVLRTRSQAKAPQQGTAGGRSWTRAACGLVSAVAIFYVFAIRFASVDWEHVLSSAVALVTATLILWSFLAIRRPARHYQGSVLAVLSVLVVGGLLGLQAMAGSKRFAGDLEQYSDYDPSLFTVQQALKPPVQEDSYSAWYRFLAHHANIRQPVQVPEVPLTAHLKPTAIKKPNIFVFVIDALRRDYISAYNPAVSFTPEFGAFARENIVFQHAYSGYAGTDLAVAAIMSGMQQLNKTFPEPVARFNRLQAMVNVDGYDCYSSYNPIVALLADKSDHITNLSADLPPDDQQEFRAIVKKLESAILTRTDRERPIFVYSQPANVHTLYLSWHRGQVEIRPHPGFDDGYASAVEGVDTTFGEFIAFLKKERLYDNSIVIVAADHGESLGEMGRRSHVDNLTPEVMEIPLMIHLPQRDRSELTWDVNQMASLHDITPTLYYLLGHRPLRQGEMIGHSLFAGPGDSLAPPPDHYFFMSGYLPVFGVLSGDRKNLFYVDAVLNRSFYYDLEHDPHALNKKVTAPILEHYEGIVRQDLKAIDKFYGVTEQQLAQSQP